MDVAKVVFVGLGIVAAALIFVTLSLREQGRRVRRVDHEVQLQRDAKYAAWVAQHRWALRLGRIAFATCVCSFIGIGLLAIAGNDIPFHDALLAIAAVVFLISFVVDIFAYVRLYGRFRRWEH